MSAERFELDPPESEAAVVRLSDGSQHESHEAAERYKAENYPDEDDYMASIRNPNLDKLMLGGATVATMLAAAGIVLAKNRREK